MKLPILRLLPAGLNYLIHYKNTDVLVLVILVIRFASWLLQVSLEELHRKQAACQAKLPAGVKMTPDRIAQLPPIVWKSNGEEATIECSQMFSFPPPPPPRPRKTLPTFDWKAYLDYNQDLAIPGILSHYKNHGHKENRIAGRIPLLIRYAAPSSALVENQRSLSNGSGLVLPSSMSGNQINCSANT